MKTVKKVKSIHEQRELQLDNNNDKKNLSKSAFDYEKPRVTQICFWVFMKIWDGKDFSDLS